MFTQAFFGNAGRFIDRRTMVWIRKFDAPVAIVWTAVSTKQGLDEWWMRPVEIDLRAGGKFSHHWENTITDLKENEFIDFSVPAGTGGMRFELKADGKGTVFSFIDWMPEGILPDETMLPQTAGAIDTIQPGGPGTHWSGVAGGWHDSMDALETYLTGKAFEHSYEDLCKWYAGYLADHFRWRALVSKKFDYSEK